MQKSIIVVFTVGALLCNAAALAANETNREIARTISGFHLKQKEFLAGATILTEHLKLDPADTEAWNLLGLLYMEAGRNDYAIISLERASADTTASAENRAIFRYNLADALNRAKRDVEAKTLLERIAKDPTVPTLLASATRTAWKTVVPGHALPKLDSEVFADTPSDWGFALAFAGGYDTNVLMYSDNLLADASSTGQESPQATLSATASYEKLTKSALWDFRMQGSFMGYSSSDAQTYNSLGSSFQVTRAPVPDPLAPNETKPFNRFDLSFLNTDGIKFYNWTDTVGAKFLTRHSSTFQTELEVPLLYQKYSFSEGSDTADDRTGFGIAPAFALTDRFGLGTLSAGLRYEGLWASGDNYKSHALALPLSFEHGLFWKVNGTLKAEPSYLTYFKSSTGRKDTTVTAGYSLSKQISSSAFTILDYSYKRNASTDDSATYSKHTISLLVTYALL